MTFNCNKLQNKLLNANNLYISYIEVKTKNEWHDYEDLLIIQNNILYIDNQL